MVTLASSLVHTSATIWVDPLVILAMIAAIGGMFIAVMRPIRKRGKELDLFLRDWKGEVERPGVERRPGVMERLADLDNQYVRLDAKVEVIHSEVQFNNGGSIKDAVNRMDRTLEGVDQRLVTVEHDIRGVHTRLDKS